MKVKICDRCGHIETEEKYHAQMEYTLPVHQEWTPYVYDRKKDLCASCKSKLGVIIEDFLIKSSKKELS